MTEDLSSLVALLRREHARVEATSVRVHVLGRAVAGDWPGSLDEADAALTDAVDRLRSEELARVVVSAGCARHLGLDDVQPRLATLVAHAPADVAAELRRFGDVLAASVDGLRALMTEALRALDDAPYGRCAWTVQPRVPAARGATLARVVRRAVPPSLDAFLDARVA